MENFRKVLFAGLSVLAFSLLAINVSAQNGHNASINPTSKQITLDEGLPLSAAYTFDISKVNVSNESQARAYFAKYATEYITFRFDLGNKVAIMELKGHLVADKPLSVSQWNSILQRLNK